MPTPAQVIRTYLDEVSRLRRTGQAVAETSYYPAVHELLSGIGGSLSPRRTALTHPALGTYGGGMPDNALYDADTGVLVIPIEIKPAETDLASIIARKQVVGYARSYGGGRVLVTNLRHFGVAELDSTGALAFTSTPVELVAAAANLDPVHPIALPNVEAALPGLLTAGTATRATVKDPEMLAALLAFHAKAILDQVLATKDHRQLLSTIHQAFKEGLGMELDAEFLVPTVVQTLVYGIFASWLDHDPGHGTYEWRRDTQTLRPLAAADLFHQIMSPGFTQACPIDTRLDSVAGVLDWVDKPQFSSQFDQGAIEYFYEPFLAAFDIDLRQKLGVWYTPQEIADYMVARADHHVRNDLGIPDGLADPSVFILDPACGTGTFLLAALRHIYAFHEARNEPEYFCQEAVRQAATTRLFGFEVLPAALVITHIGVSRWLKLRGATLGPSDRLEAMLTNSLLEWGTGRIPPIPLTGMEEDHTRAMHVKHDENVLVVVGNPPYEGYSAAENREELELLADWTAPLLNDWGVRKHRLGDLYVRFWRIGVRRIAEITNRGVVSFITNGKWLHGRSFPAMRRDIVAKFDTIRVDDLHGSVHDQLQGDESIFKTRVAPGIQVGVAIVTAVRHDPEKEEAQAASVYARDIQGGATDKRLELDTYRQAEIDDGFYPVTTSRERRWRLIERAEPDAPALDEYFQKIWSGVQPIRAETTVLSHDRTELEGRMRDYFDYSTFTAQQLFARHPGFALERARYDALAVRTNMETAHVGYDEEKIVRFLYRPLDVRWLYWETARGLITEARSTLAPHVVGVPGQCFIVTNQTRRRPDAARPTFSTAVPGWNSMDPDARAIPRLLRAAGGGTGMQLDLGAVDEPTTNVNPEWVAGARQAGISGHNKEVGDAIFFALAGIMHSPRWLATQSQDSDDFPDVPLPLEVTLLAEAAELGRRVVALHDPDTSVDGVTTGTIDPQLAMIAVPAMTSNAPVLTRGRLGSSGGEWLADQGSTGSIWINDQDRWEKVPHDVSEYSVGGYPLIRKYLSYRVGDVLTQEDIKIVTRFCRRIARLIELQDTADDLADEAEKNPLVPIIQGNPHAP
jgi:Type ISP C-terminal specificity domain/N-6 DNA Methylase